MKLHWTPQAIEDLGAIFTYISHDSRSVAKLFIDRIYYRVDQLKNFLLWERNHINALETPWEKSVIFGHTPLAHRIRRPKMIGIDTGCVFTSPGMGKLTALVLPEEEVVQQYMLDR